MKIINTCVNPQNPRFMVSFTFRAPFAEVEAVSALPLMCVKHEKQTTREGAVIRYHGGGIWEVSGYAYDMFDTKVAYARAMSV